MLGLAQGEEEAIIFRPRTWNVGKRKHECEDGRIDRKIESGIPGGLRTRNTTNWDGGGGTDTASDDV